MSKQSVRTTPTVDELIATLKRSHLPSVLVEGIDDIVVYRSVEDLFRHNFLSIIPAGNRDTVLQVFLRRNELNHLPCLIFVVDRDLWLFSGVPNEFAHKHQLIITDGYSVENDLIQDGNLVRLMNASERNIFENELDIIVRWYSLVVSRLLRGEAAELKIHVNRIVDEPDRGLFLEPAQGESFPEVLFDEIRRDTFSLLRGKNLMELLLRQLNKARRVPKHSRLSLHEHVGTAPGPRILKIIDAIRTICRFN